MDDKKGKGSFQSFSEGHLGKGKSSPQSKGGAMARRLAAKSGSSSSC